MIYIKYDENIIKAPTIQNTCKGQFEGCIIDCMTSYNDSSIIYEFSADHQNVIIECGTAELIVNDGLLFYLTDLQTNERYEIHVTDFNSTQLYVSFIIDFSDFAFGEYDYLVLDSCGNRIADGILRYVKPERNVISYSNDAKNTVYEI